MNIYKARWENAKNMAIKLISLQENGHLFSWDNEMLEKIILEK